MFDDLTDYYEAMIDWPRRLDREGPFFRRIFDQVSARRVLDMACGTGHHAARFHQWGLSVEGADASSAMIMRAREKFGESERLRWVVRRFEEPLPAGESYDSIICVGNSLALASDRAVADQAIRQMWRGLRPGGKAIVHVLNFERIPIGPCHWQKSGRFDVRGRPVLILKGVHRSADRGYVDIAILDPGDGRLLHHSSEPLTILTARELGESFTRCGALNVEFFGDHDRSPFDAATSIDLIVVATKKAD